MSEKAEKTYETHQHSTFSVLILYNLPMKKTFTYGGYRAEIWREDSRHKVNTKNTAYQTHKGRMVRGHVLLNSYNLYSCRAPLIGPTLVYE